MGKVKKNNFNRREKLVRSKPGKPVLHDKVKITKRIRNAQEAQTQLPQNTSASSPLTTLRKFDSANEPEQVQTAQPKRPLSKHQQTLQRKLESANFRMLNETLYTTTGGRAFSLMQADPSLFTTYHAGYSRQTARWPVNPLDEVLKALAAEPHDVVVADFGCGEAKLSRVARQRVHSFDLIASAPGVIACDMAKVPLPDSSVDVAVFCLSLMGTNYGDYVVEARRVLQGGGLLLIAEVASRFENQDPQEFVKAIKTLGFSQENEHPFVQDKHTSDSKSDGVEQAAGAQEKKNKRAKKRGGTKHKNKGGKSTLQFANKRMERTAFFHKFAFRSTKESRDENITTKKFCLPELSPCVYKRR